MAGIWGERNGGKPEENGGKKRRKTAGNLKDEKDDLPCRQSQKCWQEMLAGQGKNPLARLQFTDGCGSSVQKIKAHASEICSLLML
jgi:hypothetical protein